MGPPFRQESQSEHTHKLTLRTAYIARIRDKTSITSKSITHTSPEWHLKLTARLHPPHSSATPSPPSNPPRTAPNPSRSPPPSHTNSRTHSSPASPSPTNTSLPTSPKPTPSATPPSPPSTPSSPSSRNLPVN